MTSQSLILSVLDEDYSRERVVYTNLDIRTFLDIHDMTDRWRITNGEVCVDKYYIEKMYIVEYNY